MARRAPSSDSSQKENAGMPVKVKPEKVKKAKAPNREKATPLEDDNQQDRRSATLEGDIAQSENDEQEEQEERARESDAVDASGAEDAEGDDDEDAEGSARGSKRARVNDDGDAISVKSERKTKMKTRPVTLPRDTDGFVPGSIVRVKLQHFVTYDDVEFRPGPYLNMILGPNGTGKSSIACALCLGLNFPPSTLGRAAELNSFVKHGHNDGFIEIELKGRKGEGNLVIRRNLKQANRGSTFTLNGEHATAREISAKVAGLNVQVTNLCAFLPQDKVAEFAQMTPQQLLNETQRAAGDENLTTWHQSLIALGRDAKVLASNVEGERDQLTNLEQRNSLLERDVQQYQQRRQIEREVELLEVLLPFKDYLEAKVMYAEIKKVRTRLFEKVAELQAKDKPVHDFRAKLEEEYDALNKEREKRKQAAQAKFQVMKKKWQDNEKYEKDSEAVSDRLVNLKKEEKARKDRIQALKGHIHKIEQELAHPPEMEDLTAIETDYRTNNEHIQQGKRDKEDQEDQIKGYVDISIAQQRKLEIAQKEIKNLDDVDHRKLQELHRFDRDCADAVAWLRKNKHRFQMEVLEPAWVSLSVPDQRYAAAVEALFNVNQLKTFVCQCPEDYQLLNHLVVDTPEALGRRTFINTWYRPMVKEQLTPPPMAPDELHALGFEKYAIECVTCPDGLRWYLEREINLHRTAIGLDVRRVDLARAMEAVSRLGPRGEGGGASFVAGQILNSVTRSRYGRRVPQNVTRDVRPPRNLCFPPVDQARKLDIDNRIKEARMLQGEAEKEVSVLTTKLKAAEAHLVELKNEKQKVEARRKAVLDMKKRLSGLELRLTATREKLEKEEDAPTMEDERERLRKRGFDLAKKRANIVKDLKTIIRGVIEDQTEATRVGLEFLQVLSNKKALEELCNARDQETQKAREELDAADKVFSETKRDCKVKLDVAKERLAGIDDEIRATFQNMEESGEIHNRSVEDIQQELENQKAKLELNFATNPGVIEQYERRQQEIESLREKIENREQNQQKIDIKIKSTKEQWLPALQQLVTNIGEKFSAAFDRVGCAGEIRLSEHEDYDKWAIDILVKFRDSEKLQLLTGQRQSGGERALTTIMYLMSLTELARAPFSLVDEINQGMDQQYERAVHNSLVEVTCKPDSGQYFLITPKLLTDLRYHGRMKVLCVANGEWLPEEKMDGSMMKMIEAFVARRPAAP